MALGCDQLDSALTPILLKRVNITCFLVKQRAVVGQLDIIENSYRISTSGGSMTAK